MCGMEAGHGTGRGNDVGVSCKKGKVLQNVGFCPAKKNFMLASMSAIWENI